MIEIINLTKLYKNDIKAVDGLNLKIDNGDIYAFVELIGGSK